MVEFSTISLSGLIKRIFLGGNARKNLLVCKQQALLCFESPSDNICYQKKTEFLQWSSTKTASFEEQILCKNKHVRMLIKPKWRLLYLLFFTYLSQDRAVWEQDQAVKINILLK